MAFKWFNNLIIRKKLFLVFSLMIILMLITTLYSSYQLISINSSYTNLVQFSSSRHTNLTDAIEILAHLRINNVSTAYLVQDDEISQSLYLLSESEYLEMCSQFLFHINSYLQNAVMDSSLSSGQLETRLNLINEIENYFIEVFEESFYQILNGLFIMDQSLVSEALQNAYYSATHISDKLDELRSIAVQHIDNETHDIFEFSRGVIFAQFFITGLILIFSVLISIIISRAIEKPIRNLEHSAIEITGGNLDYPIRSNHRDELGILSNHIGDMVDSMKNATQAKTNFLANMSHEMRTPLNVVVGLTDLRMEDESTPADVINDLRKINSAGSILLGLVNDVLDISKIEAGKLELLSIDYETASLLNDIITLNVIRIESRPIEFIINISEDFPSVIRGDELRVKQIFNNLLSNAFKYTKEGKVSLKVNCRRDGDNVILLIEVSDTGIGIKEEDQKKLFSDYNQVDTRANRKIEGTGLGLSITKKLVEMMEGEISVHSEYGKGTSFKVEIVQSYINDNVLGKELIDRLCNFKYRDEKHSLAGRILRPDLSYAHVLVVDDYPTNLDVASGMLLKYKMQVDCAGSGQAAIDMVKKGDPVYDVIFMDHMMPEMDGIEALKRIRSLDSEYAKNIPIIFLTANALAGNEQMFLNEGFNAFLSKPINIQELDLIVKKWIRNKVKEGEISHTSQTSTEENLSNENISESIEFIPDVDMSVNDELYSGETEIYKFALSSFAKNSPLSVEKMWDVNEDNLKDYAIDIHALKSMCAAIGAKKHSKRAAELEILAKSGDLSSVLAKNKDLLHDIGILTDNIKVWLEKTSDLE